MSQAATRRARRRTVGSVPRLGSSPRHPVPKGALADSMLSSISACSLTFSSHAARLRPAWSRAARIAPRAQPVSARKKALLADATAGSG
jgi:hypothetical protein